MKLLPETIERKGFVHKLIHRDEKRAIYSQCIGEKVYAYEVFKIYQQKECDAIMGGVIIHLEHKELFPSDRSFGTTAWTYPELSLAQEKFKQLEQLEILKLQKESDISGATIDTINQSDISDLQKHSGIKDLSNEITFDNEEN